VSLAAQLLLTMVGLIAATTVVLTVVAYRTSLRNLEQQARHDVRLAAQSREQMVTQLLMLRQQRAEGFLLTAQSICAEEAGPRGYGWQEECVDTMVKEFRLTEGASGALLEFRGRRLASSGEEVSQSFPLPGAIARVVPRPDGGSDFLIRATLEEAILTIQFDTRDVLPLFQDRSGLGATGEVFLSDPDGRLLTPLRYGGPGPQPPGTDVAEPLAECRHNAGEMIDIDYRGVLTVHGYRPVAAIGGGCIDAHVPYADALGPAEAQRSALIARGSMFVLLGALLSLLAARWIAAPVRRLALSARALQAESFTESVPVAGPSEVRALGRAIAAMAEDLAKLVTREQAARREAERANLTKDRFLAMVSHELRTPLNAMLGWARLLRIGGLDGEGTSHALAAIERNAEAQRRLIEDLLDISRVVSGRLQLIRSATPVASVVEAALDAVRPRAAEKGVRLETTIADIDMQVLADGQRLQQVVWNLAWNAVKFTPTGGWVSVGLRRADTVAELTVADSGIGIPPELLPHIFEWYRQGDGESRAVESGLGLGLGLVRQLVELHDGTVSAHSAGPGSGATFVVRLPLCRHDLDTGTTHSIAS
jgi:signal transduction histidine kinase